MEQEQLLEDAILRMGYFGAGLVVGICDAQNIPLPKENLHALVLAGPALLHGTLGGIVGTVSGVTKGYTIAQLKRKKGHDPVKREIGEIVSPEEYEKGEQHMVPLNKWEKSWVIAKYAAIDCMIAMISSALCGFAFVGSGYLLGSMIGYATK